MKMASGTVSPQRTPVLRAVRTVGLTKIYGQGETRVVALDDVSIDLAAGEFTAIMGPSGSGKSTLMHCAAALDSATSGQVFLGDVELTGLTRQPARSTRLSGSSARSCSSSLLSRWSSAAS